MAGVKVGRTWNVWGEQTRLVIDVSGSSQRDTEWRHVPTGIWTDWPEAIRRLLWRMGEATGEWMGIQVIGGWQKCQWLLWPRIRHQSLHLVSAWASEHRLVLAQAKVQDKSNEITAIPTSGVAWPGRLYCLDAMGTKKYCSSDSPQVQIIFSVLNQIIPRCFNRWNSGFSKCRRMAPYPPVNTPLSLDITASTHAPFGLGGLVCCPLSSRRGQDCKVLSSWNGLVGYGTKPPTKCSSTSAVCRRIAPKLLPFSIGGLKTDCIGS